MQITAPATPDDRQLPARRRRGRLVHIHHNPLGILINNLLWKYISLSVYLFKKKNA